jgi:hypothetical protein
VLIDKINTLEIELELSKSQLQNCSSVKLDHILNSHKPFGDKCGLGFDKCASTSKTPPVNKEKINYVPPMPVEKSD